MKVFEKIFEFPWIKALRNAGGECFVVGGSVRDFLLQKTPKDIDLIVRLLPLNRLVSILLIHGKVDMVGESFSVIKFTHEGEVYDIALPRIDKPIEGMHGHKAIDAQSDYMLEIEVDLGRRDFTINAMAVGCDLVLIDPFGGEADLNAGVIRCVSEQAFIEDPLRMLRGLQFAPRFNFDLEKKTFALIESNKHLLKTIAMERIFDELGKPFKAGGNIPFFGFLLHSTGTFEAIFGRELKYKRLDPSMFLAELLHFGIADTIIDTAKFYKGFYPAIPIELLNDLKALNTLYNSEIPGPNNEDKTIFHIMFRAIKQSDIVLKSGHVGEGYKEPFLCADFPSYRSEMALDGDDLLALGFKEGKETGLILKKMLDGIFSREVVNNREALLRFIGKSEVPSQHTETT